MLKPILISFFTCGTLAATVFAQTSEKVPGIEPLHVLKCGAAVSSMRLSPDGGVLAVGWSKATDRIITGGLILWDAPTGKKLLDLDRGSVVCGLSFSSDSKYLVSACFYTSLEVCEVKTGKTVHVQNDLKKLSALEPVGTEGRFATFEDLELRLWKLEVMFRPKRMIDPAYAGYCHDFVFTSDGRTLAKALNRGDWIEFRPENPALIDLWDVEREKKIKQFSGMDDNNVQSIKLSPDGKLMAIGYIFDARNLEIREADTGKLWCVLNGHPRLVRSLVFTEDKKYLFSGDYDGTMIVWDLASKGEKKRVVRAHLQSVEYLALSKDESRLFSGSFDHSAKIWNVKDLLPK